MEAGEAGSFESFCRKRSELQPDLLGWPADGRVAVRTTTGHLLDLCFDGPHRVDGVPIDYDAWPLYEAPWVHAEMGTGKIAIEREGRRHLIELPVVPRDQLLPMRVIG